MNNLLLIAMSLFTWSAAALTSPAIAGRLANYSKLPSDRFKIEITLSCETPSIVAPGNGCGFERSDVQADRDGTYNLNALTVPDGLGYKHWAYVTVTYDDDNSSIVAGRRYRSWRFEGRDLSHLADLLKTISVYKLDSQPVTYVPSSGRSSTDWAQGTGRDSALEVRLSLPNLATDDWDNRYVYRFERAGILRKTMESTDAGLLIFPGDLGPDPQIQAVATLRYQDANAPAKASENRLAFPLKDTLPKELLTFAVSEQSPATPERRIDGSWTLHFNANHGYEPNREHNWFDGKAEVQCANGILSGRIDWVGRGGNNPKVPTKQTSAISGTCQGEYGEMFIEIITESGRKTELLVLLYDRIGNGSTSVLSSNVDIQGIFAGNDFSRQIEVINISTYLVGHLTFERR